MVKLIASCILLGCGAATALVAVASTLWAPVQYLTLESAWVPAPYLAEVREERRPNPDIFHLSQWILVPRTSEIGFHTQVSAYPETLAFRLAGGDAIRYTVGMRTDKGIKVLFDSAQAQVSETQTYRVPLPNGPSSLDLVFTTHAEGPGSAGGWIDLRVEYQYGLAWAVAFCLFLCGGILLMMWRRAQPDSSQRRRDMARMGLLVLGLGLGVAGIEFALRLRPGLLGNDLIIKLRSSMHTPESVVAYMESLDWQDPDLTYPEIGWRYLPNSRIAAGSGNGEIVTDDRGFPNKTTREEADIVVLGDSFCSTLPVPKQWPALLAGQMDKAVCNFGVGRYSTIQERAVYENVAAPLRAKQVILLFFEGNDLRDNEGWSKKLGPDKKPANVKFWKNFIRDLVVRSKPNAPVKRGADSSLLLSLLSHAMGRWAPLLNDQSPFMKPFFHTAEHEMTALHLAARRAKILLPTENKPYPVTLHLPYMLEMSQEVAAVQNRAGLDIAKVEIEKLHRLVTEHNATLYVARVPVKIRVYFQLLENALGREVLDEFFLLASKQAKIDLDPEAFLKNKDNVAMELARWCEKIGVAYIDLAGPLEAAAARGVPVYDLDTHLSEAAQPIVAEVIAAQLRASTSR